MQVRSLGKEVMTRNQIYYISREIISYFLIFVFSDILILSIHTQGSTTSTHTLGLKMESVDSVPLASPPQEI